MSTSHRLLQSLLLLGEKTGQCRNHSALPWQQSSRYMGPAYLWSCTCMSERERDWVWRSDEYGLCLQTMFSSGQSFSSTVTLVTVLYPSMVMLLQLSSVAISQYRRTKLMFVELTQRIIWSVRFHSMTREFGPPEAAEIILTVALGARRRRDTIYAEF